MDMGSFAHVVMITKVGESLSALSTGKDFSSDPPTNKALLYDAAIATASVGSDCKGVSNNADKEFRI